MSNSSDSSPITAWYAAQLSVEDAIAGGVAVSLSVIFMPLNVVVGVALKRADKAIVGYRYLLSNIIVDFFAMLVYGLLKGLSILFKTPLVYSEGGRSAVQIFLDIVFFSMCYHFPLVAATRAAAVKAPTLFKRQTRRQSYAICALPYAAATALVLSIHFRPSNVVFYYEPAIYGFACDDFAKLLNSPQFYAFRISDIIAIVAPAVLYAWTIVELFRNRKTHKASEATVKIERRLVIPCAMDSLLFIVGELFMALGDSVGGGKWRQWTNSIIFFSIAAAHPCLLLAFSPTLRSKVAFFSFSSKATIADCEPATVSQSNSYRIQR